MIKTDSRTTLLQVNSFILWVLSLLCIQTSSSVASFLVLGGGGGGQDPQMYRQKKKNLLTYMRERAPEIHIFSWLKILATSAYIGLYTLYNQFSSLLLLMVWRYKRQYTDKTITLRKSRYMRASRTSELGNFLHFHILKLPFLSIFCWYFRCYVGTNDMLVGLHVPTNFQLYRQNYIYI